MDWLLNILSQGSDALGGNLLRSIPRLMVSVSTFAIAVAAISFLWRRRDLPTVYRRVALSLILLLLGIAVSYLIAAFPVLRPSIYARVFEIVAALSALVAVFLIRYVLPELLALPSPRLLERNNRHLKSEIDAHIDTMRQLTDIRSELEEKVYVRTRELTATKQRFEAALSGSDIAVFNQDTRLVFTWAYDPRRGLTPEEVVGKTDADLFPEDVAQSVADAKRNVVESGKGTSLNVVVKTDGASQYLRLSIEPLRDGSGEIIGLTSAVVDLTERHDYETRLSALTSGLAEANARFDMALRGSSIMVFSHDRDLRYNWVYNPAIGLNADDMIGRTDEEFWQDEGSQSIVDMKKAAVASGEAQHGEIVMTLDDKPRYFQLRLEPILGRDRSIQGLAGVAVDVTEAHQQELHLRLVMRELTHRSKNLLAVIQAMARQTAARSDDPQTFVTRFSARLRAMAASHDLLVAREWHGATLKDLVSAQLSQAIDPGSDQLVIEGPMLSLRPDAVQNIGLALHELTTNAAKYGALSVPDGRISLNWGIRNGDRLHLRWEETNGPMVQQPEKTGFGVTLLERSVGQALDGIVTLEFTPGGVVCEIDIPSSHALD
ncbi:PAS domain-containing protein [Kaistia defluvii]|uniref:sensor histidine kinase n=1 Tax=Kaistia defluvii TaxID=410841 RepID=UPI0022527D50|nr:PAS domain-containing protein [Kaistia defluvii]MCX5517952.1 PAS domain-containing protein [Kaistia defluvii]